MTIANTLTIFRIFISPIFLLIYIEHDFLGISAVMLPYVLLILLGISEASDALDGFIARRYNQVTDLGKILDPMADSIARISAFLTFTLDPIKVPMILIFVILYRDSVISTLRTICAMRGFTLAARISGKIKAVIQAITSFFIVILLIPYSLGKISQETLHIASTYAVGIAACYTFFSGIDYIYANRFYIKKVLYSRN